MDPKKSSEFQESRAGSPDQESCVPKSKKAKRGGQFCVAGLANGITCSNSSMTPGISMHMFPRKDNLRRQWTRFVKRYRVNFKPETYSVGPYLCSNHFTRESYEKPFALDLPGFDSSNTRRFLKKDAVPTVFDPERRNPESGSTSAVKVTPARERRAVRVNFFISISLLL